MTLALAKRETSYEDHEAAYLAELRPHGVLEMATAKTMAGIAWKIEEVDHALANALAEAKEAWVTKGVRELAATKYKTSPECYPVGGKSELKQDRKTLKGLEMWQAIVNGEDVTIDCDALAHAYLAICDYSSGMNFIYWDEHNERDIYCVPNDGGAPSVFDQVHEWGEMSQAFTLEKICFLSGYLESKSKHSLSINEMIKQARHHTLDSVSKADKWFDALRKKKEELESKPLPLDLALPEIERARKLQKELTNDLWREKERLDRMRAPSVTIEHAPLLDNLSL